MHHAESRDVIVKKIGEDRDYILERDMTRRKKKQSQSWIRHDTKNDRYSDNFSTLFVNRLIINSIFETNPPFSILSWNFIRLRFKKKEKRYSIPLYAIVGKFPFLFYPRMFIA